MAEPVTVGHRHIGSADTSGPDGPTAGVTGLRVRPRYTLGIREVHLAPSCRVTGPREITDRVHRWSHLWTSVPSRRVRSSRRRGWSPSHWS